MLRGLESCTDWSQPVEGVDCLQKSAAAANINRQMTTDGIGKIYLAVTDRKLWTKKRNL